MNRGFGWYSYRPADECCDSTEHQREAGGHGSIRALARLLSMYCSPQLINVNEIQERGLHEVRAPCPPVVWEPQPLVTSQ